MEHTMEVMACTGMCHSKEEYDVCKSARYWEDPAHHAYMQKYGKHFSRNLAHAEIKMPKWSCDEVSAALQGFGITLDETTKYDAFYLANTAYSNFYGKSLKTEESVLQYVVDVMHSRNGYEGMIFDMWVAKAMGECREINWTNML